MQNFEKNGITKYVNLENIKRKVFLEVAATAMLANLKLRKQKS